MEILVVPNGMYPRGEALIQATRDFDRHRISLEELEQAYTQDYRALEALQQGAALVSDGLLNWQDLVRPFAELTGAQPGPLTRYFETNTFYRRLLFPRRLTWGETGPWAQRYFRFGNAAFLPAPYTFARMAENLTPQDAAQLLAVVVEHLTERGYTFFSLQEPFAVYEGNSEALRQLQTAFADLRQAAGQARLVLTFYFGDAAPLLPAAWELPIDGVGVDLTYTDLAQVDVPQGQGLMLGLVDTTNSLLETRKVVQEALDLALAKAPAFLVLSGSSDFFFLPRDVADAKYRFLRQLAEELSPKV